MNLLQMQEKPSPQWVRPPTIERRVAIFDLYGTLIALETRTLLKRISGYLGARTSPEVFRQSMTLRYDDEIGAVRGFIELLVEREATDEEVAHCKALLDDHLATAQVIKGAVPLLAFLRRRGFRLALLSNVAQIFKRPFYDLGLHPYFDVVHFSSDTGRRKPDRDAYLAVCQALGATPEECLFFGDDAKNDYDGPLALSMRPVHIGLAPRAESVAQLSDLLWTSLSPSIEPLLAPGQRVTTDRGFLTVEQVEQLQDADLGLYNLVARVHGRDDAGQAEIWYAKRFLDTSSVHVEMTAHALMAAIGVTVPRAFTTRTREPILFVSPAKGRLWQEGDFTARIAEELGAQAAAAYVVSNADWRPRNTFLCPQTGVLTAIDLEHCLFDRVLSLEGTGINVNDPASVNSLGNRTCLFTRTRVLSYGAVRRARRSFTKNEDRCSEEIRLFRKGWERTFSIAAEHKQVIADIIRQRMDRGELIVGTKSHRRAFSAVDLHDLLERIDLGKRVVHIDEVWGVKK